MSAASSAAERERAQSLWRQWQRTGLARDRERTILALRPLVRHLVGQTARRIPASIDVQDLEQAGMIGAVHAVDRYDPALADTGDLSSYAWSRIQGAIVDELRGLDWAPRKLRPVERKVERAVHELAAARGRWPPAAAVADELGMTVRELARIREQIQRADVLPANALIDRVVGDETDIEIQDTIPSPDPGPAEIAELAEQHAAAAAAVWTAAGRLNGRARWILVMRWIDDMTLREIGDVLGITESRVCQIERATQRFLRDELAHVA